MPSYRFQMSAFWSVSGQKGYNHGRIRSQTTAGHFQEACSLSAMITLKDAISTLALQPWWLLQERKPDVLGRSPLLAYDCWRERRLESGWTSSFRNRVREPEPFWCYQVVTPQIVQLQTCIAQDPALMALKTTVITGWPELRKQVLMSVREYWLYRDEISVNNGLLFKNHRVVRIVWSSGWE